MAVLVWPFGSVSGGRDGFCVVAVWVARCVFGLTWWWSGQRQDGSCRLELLFSLASYFLSILPTLYSIGFSQPLNFSFLFIFSFIFRQLGFTFFWICIFLKRFIWTGLKIHDFGGGPNLFIYLFILFF